MWWSDIKRPQQHITDDAGARLLRQALEPLGWTFNETSRDYGIDYDVQVFHEHVASGAFVKVQLKSSKNPQQLAAGNAVAISLPVQNARYLAQDLRVPVILVVADTTAGTVYWHAIQLDRSLREALTDTTHQTITVHVSTKHTLPTTVTEMLDALRRVENGLASRLVTEASVRHFVAGTRAATDDVDRVIREMQEKGDALRLTTAYERLNQGNVDAAHAQVRSVAESTISSVEARFKALLIQEVAETTRLIEAGRSDRARIDSKLSIAAKMHAITRRGPKYLKGYALIYRKAAQLDALLHEDWGWILLRTATAQKPDAMLKALAAFGHAQVVRRIKRKIDHCLRLIQFAVRTPYSSGLSGAILRVVHSINLWNVAMDIERQRELAASGRILALDLCQVTAGLAARAGDVSSLARSAEVGFIIDANPSSASWQWADSVVAQLPDGKDKEAALALRANALRRATGDRVEGPIKTTPRQIHGNIANSLGIDIDDPNDPAAELIRIGIADRDPSRVLRNCEHIYVTLDGGSLADIVQLPTACGKVIHCTLHRHASHALSLDAAYEAFRKAHCEGCPDVRRRPENWTWSHEWQDEENLRRAAFFEEWLATARLSRLRRTAPVETKDE